MCKLERHRRVVPEDVFLNAMSHEKLARQIFHHCVDGDLASESFGQVWHHNVNSRIRLPHIEAHRAVPEDWFFNKEDAMLSGTTRQKMLWALIHEIPAQVREDDQICLACVAGWQN